LPPILFQLPVISVRELEGKLEKSYNSTNSIINKFVEAKILFETTNQKRNKLFCFQEYLNLLDKEY